MPELLVIFFVILLLFGGNKIKDIGKGLGEGIREFKNAMNETPTKKENEGQK